MSLDTSSYFCKRICPSVGRSVGQSVGWSVGPSFRRSRFHILKKMRVVRREIIKINESSNQSTSADNSQDTMTGEGLRRERAADEPNEYNPASDWMIKVVVVVVVVVVVPEVL